MRYDLGIGNARLVLNPAALPAQILLRLHLHGLEQLAIDNGAGMLQISLSSNPPYTVMQDFISGQGSQTLTEGDVLWATVTPVTDDESAATIPLQNGHFDVLLPVGMVDAEHNSLALAWVDFYR